MNKQAFSVIELLIVVAVISVLAALGGNAWRGYAARQELQGAAREVYAAFAEARSDARRTSQNHFVTWNETSITSGNSNGEVETQLRSGITITTPTDRVTYTAPFARAQLPTEDELRITLTSDRFEGANTRQIIVYGVTGKAAIYTP